MLSESFLKSLSGLRLWSVKRRPGTYTGDRRSTRRGRSVEFADYRNYVPGDDPRRVDWNIFARLERPYIKLYEEEEDLTVHMLLDVSSSMKWDEEADDLDISSRTAQASQAVRLPPKWNRASQIAIALGHIILSSGDRLMMETSNRAHFGPKRGAVATSQLISFVESQWQDGKGHVANLNQWLKNYAVTARGGMVILISDLLDEHGCEEGINAIGSKFDLNVLHTLAAAEIDPIIAGDLRLKDIETASAQDVSLDLATIRRYKERVQSWSSELNLYCKKRGGRYLMIDTSSPIEQIVLRDLRKEGWLV